MIKGRELYPLLILLLVSCWQSNEIQMEQLEGTYIFEYPSGEVEVLSISNDSSYEKHIYTTYEDFKTRGIPKYRNDGRWSISPRNELQFDNWLNYNSFRDPKAILPEPSSGTMLNVGWKRQGFGRKAEISVYEETGYVFEKLD